MHCHGKSNGSRGGSVNLVMSTTYDLFRDEWLGEQCYVASKLDRIFMKAYLICSSTPFSWRPFWKKMSPHLFSTRIPHLCYLGFHCLVDVCSWIRVQKIICEWCWLGPDARGQHPRSKKLHWARLEGTFYLRASYSISRALERGSFFTWSGFP